MSDRPKASWSWTSYGDCGEVLEMGAVYDDALKKDQTFTNWAVKVANRILADKNLKGYATFGKWGARLEPLVNSSCSREELEAMATEICNHPCFQALLESTYVFTYGEYPDQIYDYQSKKKLEAEELEKKQQKEFWDRLRKKIQKSTEASA